MTFREKLTAGRQVITFEITPPHGPDVAHFRETALKLKPYFDAANVTDNQRALMRMSNLATASLLVQMGLEPIYQLTCRDRNSLALQADLLGAQALGIPNVLCLTGDPVKAGHFTEAKPVFEFESVGMLNMIRGLKEGKDSSGRALDQPLTLFTGAVVNPSVANPAAQIRRMEKKIEAGAQFFQTQAIFSAETLESFMKQIAHLKVPVIAGLLVVRSLKSARFLHDKVPGVFVPDALFQRLEQATDQAQAGIDYAIELSQQFLGLCQGVHLMSIKNEECLAEIVERGQLRKGL